jgi:hypothetical protein
LLLQIDTCKAKQSFQKTLLTPYSEKVIVSRTFAESATSLGFQNGLRGVCERELKLQYQIPMPAQITFFPVDTGDMTLIKFESGRNLLIDVMIRASADDPDDPTPDVAAMLRERLPRDAMGRLYVDAFLLTHPDKDHCTGLGRHFHLGPPETWTKGADKIFIREVWSSPMVFRRASRILVLCDEAKAFHQEARRRVAKFRETFGLVNDGDRIQVLGKDENGKTDDLGAILVEVDETFSRIGGAADNTFLATLLAPHPKSEDEETEDRRAKNHSSTVIRFSLTGGGVSDRARYLSCGDAEVAIWDGLWELHQHAPDKLSYDMLLTPHHCSWHSLSYDSWSDLGDDAKVCENARKALGQARAGALIISSSKAISDDDNDPPCIRAKREYEDIATEAKGQFKCTGDDSPEDPLEFEVTSAGLRAKTRTMSAAGVLTGAVGSGVLPHG